MPTEHDLDKMTDLLTDKHRFSQIVDFETKCRIMELTIKAVRNNVIRYK